MLGHSVLPAMPAMPLVTTFIGESPTQDLTRKTNALLAAVWDRERTIDLLRRTLGGAAAERRGGGEAPGESGDGGDGRPPAAAQLEQAECTQCEQVLCGAGFPCKIAAAE